MRVSCKLEVLTTGASSFEYVAHGIEPFEFRWYFTAVNCGRAPFRIVNDQVGFALDQHVRAFTIQQRARPIVVEQHAPWCRLDQHQDDDQYQTAPTSAGYAHAPRSS